MTDTDRRMTAERGVYDMHVHSSISHDGHDSIERICEHAIKNGLAGFALTDHCDIDRGSGASVEIFAQEREAVARAREQYGDRLKILLGTELGEISHDTELSRRIWESPDADYILASLHALRGEEDFYYMDYDSIDLDALISRYCAELREIAETCEFDALAHIGYQVRYMSESARERVDFRSHKDELDPALKLIAERGLGIEVNSSATSRYDKMIPELWAIERFKELGGEVVVYGSDSHRARAVGGGAESAFEMMRRAGFKYCAYFERRQPVFVPI